MRSKMILSLLVSLTIIVGASFGLVASQEKEEILFVKASSIGKGGDLWSIKIDRTNLRQLTNNGNIISGSWSPDRKFLAYGTKVDGALGAIWIQKINAPTSAKRLSSEKGNADPVWSPSGKQIAFVSWNNGSYSLMLADVETYNIKTIYTSKEPLSKPNWAPDGKSIAITEGFNIGYGIIVVKLSGEKEEITERYHSQNPAWDWTGENLVYNNYFTNNGTQKEEEKELGIWIWNRLSKEKINIISGSLEEQPIQPVWSRDNSQIAYVVVKPGFRKPVG